MPSLCRTDWLTAGVFSLHAQLETLPGTLCAQKFQSLFLVVCVTGQSWLLTTWTSPDSGLFFCFFCNVIFWEWKCKQQRSQSLAAVRRPQLANAAGRLCGVSVAIAHLPLLAWGRSQPTRLPPSDILWGHGSGVATCRRSISMSGMLVNQLHFAGGKFWVWLRRVAQFMKRMSIKRRLPLTVRTRHEEMPSGTLAPPEHSQVLHDRLASVFWLRSSSEVFKMQPDFFFFFCFYFCASAK